MGIPNLIYCAGGNKSFMDIAMNAGFLPGSQLPKTVYSKFLYFADQDWKNPNRAAYMRALQKHRPTMATVIDWERQEQYADVMSWAEEAAEYCEMIVIIPKISGTVEKIPRYINGRDVILAYSIPTKFGSTPCLPSEFSGRTVHLLGGSPHQQMDYWRQMPYCDIFSIDGNFWQLKAVKFCEYWQHPGRWTPDGNVSEPGGNLRAFSKSATNIARSWADITHNRKWSY